MAAPRTLRVPPDSELSHLLHEAIESGELVTIDTGDAVYRVGVESLRPSGPVQNRPTLEEVERSRGGIREAAGSWSDSDAEAFKDYVRVRRRTANRSCERVSGRYGLGIDVLQATPTRNGRCLSWRRRVWRSR